MENIKYITIEFENCECITFPIAVFGECHLSNISTSIDRVAMNAIRKSVFARTIALEIFSLKPKMNMLRENFLGKNIPFFNDLLHIVI